MLLDALEALVEGRIFVAHDDLNNALTNFRTNSGNVANEGTIGIQEEQQTITASTQGPCTNVREQSLNRLADRLTGELNIYINDVDIRASSTISDGRYRVDVLIKKVHGLDFQLSRCREDSLQSVETEILAVQSLSTTLRRSVQTCRGFEGVLVCNGSVRHS